MTAGKNWATLARLFDEAPPADFTMAARLAGLEPASDFKFAYWAGADFRNADLSRSIEISSWGTRASQPTQVPAFDFTGANLVGCNFTGARIAGARFDQAQIDVVRPNAMLDPKRTNLRAAKDWDTYVKTWKRAPELPPDDHLPVGAVFQDAPFAPEMVVVPAGQFMMGSNKNENAMPMREVTIAAPFAVGRFQVTFDEWDAALAAGGVKHNPKTDWGRGRQPVMRISWEDAQQYCAWLFKVTGQSYRLLSEAEWEYACRATTETEFAWGDKLSAKQAHFSEGASGSAKKTVEVGSFPANRWGLHDMHGNVWEWVEDAHHSNYNDAPADGSARQGDPSLRVLRGGSWFFNPGYLRSAFRFRFQPVNRSDFVGFRLARTLSPPSP